MNKKVKRGLHLFFKIFIIFLLITTVINIILFLSIYLNHKSKLTDEQIYMTPPGQMVDTGNGKMHVYQTGNKDSDITLVFMHSANVVDDSIALQPLFDKLGDYKIVYIDRLGYGFSEGTKTARTVENITEEMRTALDKTGVKGKYILVPTGTSGIEAIHWANTYPDEVEGIIGINMNYPEQFAQISADEYCGFFDWILVHFCNIGGQRLMKQIYPDNAYQNYTEMQMKVRDALISKDGYTETMYNEDLETVSNAAKVVKEGWPEKVDMLLLYANPLMEPYVSTDEEVQDEYNQAVEKNSGNDYVELYNQPIKEYYAPHKNAEVKELAGPARLYTYSPQNVASEIVNFIEKHEYISK